MTLRKQDKYLIRQLVVVVVIALLMTAPLIAANELFFMDRLGWDSLSFPLLVVGGVMVPAIVRDAGGYALRLIRRAAHAVAGRSSATEGITDRR